MMSQTQTAGANQYGFYAVPKALQPKKKYRDNIDDDYEDEEDIEDTNPFATIEDKQPANEKQLQRDYYVDEAPYPEFKPKQRGLDYGVQIQRGDLFDFDLEVRPLIEIIVGRTVVSALNELQEQKEKNERREHLDKYQKKRNAQLMITQRLEAKHKRKIEQSERRKLQKQIFVKNQKQAAKKLIARKNAKECLFGFKDELFGELEENGYLRSESLNDLKIKYEDWLYQKIVQALKFNDSSSQAAIRIIEEEQKKFEEEHKKAIDAQMGRRQIIHDEREKVRKEVEARKEKKRIKKMRQKLNSQREPQFVKFQQILQRYDQIQSILKHGDRSNGFSRNFAARPSVYVTGGLDNYLIALLSSTNRQFTADQIEGFLIKIMQQSGKDLEFGIIAKHFDKLEQLKKRISQNKAQFMKDKQNQIKDIIQQISLDLSILEATGVHIKSSLQNHLLEALLSIHLTVQPEASQEQPHELDEKNKKRLQYAERIVIKRHDEPLLQRLSSVNEILRVHFEIPQASEVNENQKIKTQQEDEQWIDIYDGQSWSRRVKASNKKVNRSEQTAASYNLGTFQNSFVIDERNLHYLEQQLEKVLDIQAGQTLKSYCENLSNISVRVKDKLAVFDGQILWN